MAKSKGNKGSAKGSFGEGAAKQPTVTKTAEKKSASKLKANGKTRTVS